MVKAEHVGWRAAGPLFGNFRMAVGVGSSPGDGGLAAIVGGAWWTRGVAPGALFGRILENRVGRQR